LRIDPTWPEVFIAALTAPERRPPMSRQVPHAAPRRKFDDAPPNAIRIAAATGDATKVLAIVNAPAAASEPPPIVTRPSRRPHRRAARSVAIPPPRSAAPPKTSRRPGGVPAGLSG